jgi:MFS family permease
VSRRTRTGNERVLSPEFVRVTAANFFFFMTFATFFLLPLRIHELGGNDQQVGLVMGMLGLAGLAGVLFVGAMIDRLGSRPFLRGGLAGMAVISLAFAFVDRVGPEMMVLRALQGLAFAAGFNATSTCAAAFAPPDRRATALGLLGVSTLTTHALAPTIGEQIVAVASFPVLFALSATFSAIGLVIAWSLPDPLGAAANGRTAAAAAAAAAAARAPAEPAPGLSSAMRITLVVTALCGISFGAVMTFVPTFTLEAHLGPVATFFLSYTSAAIATRLFASRTADDFGHRRVVLPGIALLSLAILGLAGVHTTGELAAAGVAFGFAQGVVYPTLNAFSVDLAGDGQLGRVQTFYNGSFNLGVTSGALALGPVVHAYGHRVMFACAATTALVAVPLFAVGSRREAASAPSRNAG